LAREEVKGIGRRRLKVKLKLKMAQAGQPRLSRRLGMAATESILKHKLAVYIIFYG
jgi:hypothetical protein